MMGKAGINKNSNNALILFGVIILSCVAYFLVFHTTDIIDEPARETLYQLNQLSHNGHVIDKKQNEFDVDQLFLDGQKIAENDHVGISYIYPRKLKPDFVIAYGTCGGNASFCADGSAIFIDLSDKDHAHTEMIDDLSSEGIQIHRIDRNSYKILGLARDFQNDLGDAVPLQYIYNKNDKSILLDNPSIHYLRQFIGAHPEKFLSDDTARKPILKYLKPNEFKQLRDYISVSGVMKSSHFGRVIYGSGMAPHSGGNPGAFIAVDTALNKFLIIYIQGDLIFVRSNYSDIKSSSIPSSIVDEFLEKYRTNWSKVQESSK